MNKFKKIFLSFFLALASVFVFASCSNKAEKENNSKEIEISQEIANKTFTIIWKNYDGTVLEVDYVKGGQIPTYDGDTPEKPSTQEYTYKFNGWDKEVVKTTENKTYTASFKSIKNKYTYVFYDDDGITEIKRKTVDYGTIITAPFSNPTKSEDERGKYTFQGWYTSPTGGYLQTSFGELTEDIAFYARYSVQTKSYKITWLNEHGFLIDTTTVEYGEIPTHATPTKQGNQVYSYKFTGWSPEVTNVTGEATYKATFEQVYTKYTYKFMVGDEVYKEATIDYGQAIESPGDVTIPEVNGVYYTFNGWFTNPEFEGQRVTRFGIIKSDITYYASLTRNVREFTITWLNSNGTLIDETIVKYGETPTHATPTKDSTISKVYTFAGWTPDVVPATYDATYQASYTESIRTYRLKIVDMTPNGVSVSMFLKSWNAHMNINDYFTYHDFNYGDVTALCAWELPEGSYIEWTDQDGNVYTGNFELVMNQDYTFTARVKYN